MARMKKITKILFGTTSKGKIEEVRYMLSRLGIEVVGLEELGKDIPEPEETGMTFLDCARDKAKFYSTLTKLPVLAEDDGILIEALGGKPGIYTKRFPAMNGSDLNPVDYILQVMEGKRNRHCAFRSGMVLWYHGKELFAAEGIVDGRLTTECRGNLTWMQFDKIFIPSRRRLTYAEMGVPTKCLVPSHRAIACRHIMQYLQEKFDYKF